MNPTDPIIEIKEEHLFPTGSARNQMQYLGVTLSQVLYMLQTSKTALRKADVSHPLYANPVDMTIDEINGRLVIVVHHKLWLTPEGEPFIPLYYVDEATDVEKKRFYGHQKK